MEVSSMLVEKESVMTMAEEDVPLRVCPLEHLPDIVPSPSVIRRNRSVSISLPVDMEACQRIGRNLRRLSDEFEGCTNHCRRQRRGTMDGTYKRPS